MDGSKIDCLISFIRLVLLDMGDKDWIYLDIEKIFTCETDFTIRWIMFM